MRQAVKGKRRRYAIQNLFPGSLSMKRRVVGWLFGLVLVMSPLVGAASAQEEETTIRIGTYDNRSIAVAYAASEFNPVSEKMRAYQEAKQAGDKAAIKELEAWGKAHQEMLHFQGFARVPVDQLLEPVRDGVDALAEAQGLSAITMACDFTAPNVEVVDVTVQLVELYNPSDRTREMAKKVRDAEPVPLSTVAAMEEGKASESTPSDIADPALLDMEAAEREVAERYAAVRPAVREYVRWTAGTFGKSGLWLNQNAFDQLSGDQREQKIVYLAAVLEDSDYGRHLGRALAEASALQDERLVPGLMKVAGYHRDDADYDCRPKWMAVAALARQESDDAVPMLIGLIDHGNQNTRTWAQAALARTTGQDFEQDKQAWADWWLAQGHEPVDAQYLGAWTAPGE